MSHSWYINLKEEITREEFDKITRELGINFSPRTVGGNTYYDNRLGASVEIDFGGVAQHGDDIKRATQITLSTVHGQSGVYESLKQTALDLSKEIPFKDIQGEWFYEVLEPDPEEEGEYIPALFGPEVFDRVETCLQHPEEFTYKKNDEALRKSLGL